MVSGLHSVTRLAAAPSYREFSDLSTSATGEMTVFELPNQMWDGQDRHFQWYPSCSRQLRRLSLKARIACNFTFNWKMENLGPPRFLNMSNWNPKEDVFLSGFPDLRVNVPRRPGLVGHAIRRCCVRTCSQPHRYKFKTT
jgi:hypothetical protein